MQCKARFAKPNELDRLARRFQRIANALTRLARTAHDYPLLLKLGTLAGAHLTRLERSLSRVCGDAAVQVTPRNPEIGRSLLV